MAVEKPFILRAGRFRQVCSTHAVPFGRCMRLKLVSIVAIFLCLCFAARRAGGQEPPANGQETGKKILLLGQSPDGHPAATHEYMAGLTLLKQLLLAQGVEAELVRADDPWTEGPEKIAGAGGAVLFLAEGARWVSDDPRRLDALGKLASRGGGLCVLHWGMGTREAKNIDNFLKLFGACHGGPDRKYKVVEVQAAPSSHAIATGVPPFAVKDEFYYALKRVKAEKTWQPVLNVPIEGADETVAWAYEREDGGRSFGFSGLHFHENWKLTGYRRLVVQGVLWSLKMEIPKEGADVRVDEAALALPSAP